MIKHSSSGKRYFLVVFIFLLAAQQIAQAQQARPWFNFTVTGAVNAVAVGNAFLSSYSKQLSEDYEALNKGAMSGSVFTWDATSGPGCQDGFVVTVRVSQKEGDFPETSYKVFFLAGKGPRFEVWEPVDYPGPSESVDSNAEGTLSHSPNGKCYFVSILNKTSAPTGGLTNSERLYLYYWSPRNHSLTLALNAHLVFERMPEEGFSKELTIPESKKPIYDVEVRASEDGPAEVYTWRDGVYVRK